MMANHYMIQSSKTLIEKLLKIELCAICESLGNKQNSLWVSSSNQLADCLTKEGASRGKLCDVLSGNTNNNIY